MDNHQGPAIQPMELCSMLRGSLDERGIWGRMDTCICMAESLCCSLETVTTLFIDYACLLSHFSHVRLFATLRTVACQTPLSMGFSRQKYWNGLPFPFPGDFPNLGTEPSSPASPALQTVSLLLSHLGNCLIDYAPI